MSAPPHNMAAEMAVLGAILSDNGAYQRVADALAADDFWHPANQAIYDTAARLIAEGRVADGVTLKRHFEKAETLQSIGGAKYLADLLESRAFGPEILDYAALVRELASRRRLIDAAHHIAREAEAHDGIDGKTVEDLAGVAQAAIDRAMRTGERRKFFTTPARAVASTTKAMERRGGGVSTGLTTLDRKIGGLFPNDSVVLAGRPSMGKTALALQIASNVAEQEVPDGEEGGAAPPAGLQGDQPKRRVVGFFSLEMGGDEISQRHLSACLFAKARHRLPYRNMRNGWTGQKDYAVIRDVAPLMPHINVDDRPDITVGYMRERMGALMKTYKRLDLIIVDYLQLMDMQLTKYETPVAGLTRITKGLKRLAKEFGCPVMALSQLSRKVEEREDKRPQLADLRESGSIEQDADLVMFCYREHYYLERQGPPKKKADQDDYQNSLDRSEPHFDIIVSKQRNGPIGEVEQFWDAPSGFIADAREDVTL